MAKVMKALHTTFGLPGPPESYVQKTEPRRGQSGSSEGTSTGRSGGQSSGQSSEEKRTCRVCQRHYSPDADGKRLPRDLNCGHVFCQRCLTECMSTSGSKNFVPCPVCKKKTTLLGSSVLELPVNRDILALVRSHQSKHQHRHHHDHSHRHSGSDERQVRIGDGGSGNLERSSRSQERSRSTEISRSQDRTRSHGGEGCGQRRNCSCHRDKVIPAKQEVVVKSALKKLRINDGTREEDHTAVIKAPSRLHPPPKGSLFAAILGEDGSGLSIGSANDLVYGDESNNVTQNHEEIDVISNEVIPVVRNQYPLQELHQLAPPSFVEDMNAAHAPAHGHHDVITSRGHVTDDTMTSLIDMLHMQPTTASYINSFGRYNEVRGISGDFCGPTKISCSRENKVLVIDPDLDSVQAFSNTGDSLANFSVTEVTGGCFLNESTLAVSSTRGVELYRLSGRLLLTIPLGLTVAVVRHPDGGFVAAQPTKVSIGQDPTTTVQVHTITSVKGTGQFKRHFIDVTDVAVTRSGLIAVLDDQSVIVTDRQGALQALIDLPSLVGPSTRLPDEASDLFKPFSLALDPLSGNIIVSDSDNRCISAYSIQGGGDLVRCLVNFRDQVENDDVRPYGIAVNSVGQLFIVLRARGLAEIAIYNI